MTREPNKKKYERILERLAKGDKQSSIIMTEKCSYGTISAAKQWDKNGRPNTITTTRSTSTNRTKIVLSIPNFWLEYLNEDIMSGIWADYSDAIVDIIRTYFRSQMEPHTHVQIETPRGGRGPTRLRKEIMGELKDIFPQVQEHLRPYDDSISIERAKRTKESKDILEKRRERILSILDQKSEAYIFKNYHGEPLIEEEYDVLIELERQIGRIPKWEGDFTRGDYTPTPTDIKSYKFSYVLLGNHVIKLNLYDKGLNYLPESISQLKFLQILDLRNNNLTELPESIGNLEFLEELILHDNALKSVPESIGNLKNLVVLHLDNNELTTLPDTICNLKTWYPIGLSNNKIASLSEKILKMCIPPAKVSIYAKVHGIRKNRCELDLVGNPIMEAKK